MQGSTIAGLAVALAAISAACGSQTPTSITSPIDKPLPPKQALMAAFDRNLATWQASGIARYAFTFAPSCFCNTTPHLVVADGNDIRIDGVAPNQQTSAPAGVPGLFEMVRRAIKGDQATIVYDESTGVPITMDSDPVTNEVDDEYAFKVSEWTLDPPDDRLLGSISTARQLWDRQALQTYTWSIKIACDCFHDSRRYDITVKDDALGVRSRGKAVPLVDLDGVPLTVPAFFDLTTGWAATAEARVTFDGERGYPSRVEVHDARPGAVQSETITVASFAIP